MAYSSISELLSNKGPTTKGSPSNVRCTRTSSTHVNSLVLASLIESSKRTLVHPLDHYRFHKRDEKKRTSFQLASSMGMYAKDE